MAEPLVSVVIVNFNRADLLRDCLESVLRQNFESFEVIVVDNGSTDGSESVARGSGDPRIQWFPLTQNMGFAAGCNAGIRASRGDLIALLNNDAVADENWLSALVGVFSVRPEIGMCASRIRFQGSQVIDKVGHLMFPDGQNRGRGTGEVDQGQYDQEGEVFFPDGCAAMYRRALLDQTQGFDEQFFAYGDDADLGVRARLLGWSSWYAPEALVFHRRSATSGEFSPQRIYWIERNRFWLAVKSFPMPLLLVTPLLTLYRWLWNLVAAMTGRGPAGHFSGRHELGVLVRTMLRAYKDGLKGMPDIVRKRRLVRRSRRISDWQFYRLLWRYRIPARVISFQGR